MKEHLRAEGKRKTTPVVFYPKRTNKGNLRLGEWLTPVRGKESKLRVNARAILLRMRSKGRIVLKSGQLDAFRNSARVLTQGL
jgi:hypothetical protein